MRILITGNMGYVGPVLSRHLRQAFPQAEIIGFDTGFFAHCLTSRDYLAEAVLDRQIFGDTRDIPSSLLEGMDAVVHLAAISNDPMGKRFEDVTAAVNQKASIRLAEMAAAAGVKNFVFASSCSVYGAAEGGPRKEGDGLSPLTAYARSKIGTEEGVKGLKLGSMTATCLRFATACGMSPRLRLDLVVNDFVACALANGEISVLSDGTPWRPLIAVPDMARAIEWAIQRKPDNGGQFLSVNAGSDEWNYQVRDLAKAVAEAVPGTCVSINTDAPPDKRSYQVDFRLFRSLAPQYQPKVHLTDAIVGLRDGLQSLGFADRDFRNSQHIRLRVLEGHMAAGRLTGELRWTFLGDSSLSRIAA
jgi:nucleoside-diphosphate-sugar epimerase